MHWSMVKKIAKDEIKGMLPEIVYGSAWKSLVNHEHFDPWCKLQQQRLMEFSDMGMVHNGAEQVGWVKRRAADYIRDYYKHVRYAGGKDPDGAA